MLAKLTARNRLTLPKAALAAVETAEYFDVTVENGRIVLTPVQANSADAVRAIAAVETAEYFDVTVENGRIVLTPVQAKRRRRARQTRFLRS